MRHSLLFCILCLLVISIPCQACTPGSTPQPVTKSTSTSISAIPTAGLPAKSTSVPTSPDVLTACPIAEQSQAMRASQIPDWQHIGIFACYQLTFNSVRFLE